MEGSYSAPKPMQLSAKHKTDDETPQNTVQSTLKMGAQTADMDASRSARHRVDPTTPAKASTADSSSVDIIVDKQEPSSWSRATPQQVFGTQSVQTWDGSFQDIDSPFRTRAESSRPDWKFLPPYKFPGSKTSGRTQANDAHEHQEDQVGVKNLVSGPKSTHHARRESQEVSPTATSPHL